MTSRTITKSAKKAALFLELHHSGKLLILPNIWNVIGVKLLESQGFKAIATASASVAFANGFNDGEEIRFDHLLNILNAICKSTELPVSADIEKGYAKTDRELVSNIKALIKSGIVGINIEDSIIEGGDLVSVEQQCEKIRLIRKVSDKSGIHMVINARTDVFLSENYQENKTEEAITRGRQYKDAGADCFYPILCGTNELREIISQLDMPVNVLATKDTLPMRELEKLGIARLSLGPSLLKSALTKMKEVLLSLKKYEGYETFTNPDIITSGEIVSMIKA